MLRRAGASRLKRLLIRAAFNGRPSPAGFCRPAIDFVGKFVRRDAPSLA
jgi:hypothetical protein